MTVNSVISGIDDRSEEVTKYLVALDIDGTLVDHDGLMSDGVRAAAQAVVDAGHHVILATGRSLGALLPIVEAIRDAPRIWGVFQRRGEYPPGP